MAEQNDHDLLIELNVNVKSVMQILEGIGTWKTDYDTRMRDAEKAIITLTTKVSDLDDSKRTWLDRGWNALNSLGLFVIGYLIQNK